MKKKPDWASVVHTASQKLDEYGCVCKAQSDPAQCSYVLKRPEFLFMARFTNLGFRITKS